MSTVPKSNSQKHSTKLILSEKVPHKGKIKRSELFRPVQEFFHLILQAPIQRIKIRPDCEYFGFNGSTMLLRIRSRCNTVEILKYI